MSRTTAWSGAAPYVWRDMVLSVDPAASGPLFQRPHKGVFGSFVIQCGTPSLVLVWYCVLSAGVWALVMRLRGGEGLGACPP